jgi:hypothetical protein
MAGKSTNAVVIPLSSGARAKPRNTTAPESTARRKRPVKPEPRCTTGTHRKRGWLWRGVSLS